MPMTYQQCLEAKRHSVINKGIEPLWIPDKMFDHQRHVAELSKSSKGRVKPESAKDILSRKMKGRKIKWKDKLKESNRKFDDNKLQSVLDDLKTMKVKDVADKYSVHRTTVSKIKAGTYKVFKQKTVNYKKPRRYDMV